MSVESALLFETVEQIYSRVFRTLRPKAEVPAITVRWRAFANGKSRVCLEGSCLVVDLSVTLESAPAPVQEDVAFILLAKLFRRTPERSAMMRYRQYLDQVEYRGELQAVKRRRGWKLMRPPEGAAYNLQSIFSKLNQKYFGGQLAQPILGWSMRPSRVRLGHYDPYHRTIILNSVLDSPAAPPLVVEYVLYHEILHLQCPVAYENGRRRVHTREFRAAEEAFEEISTAKASLKKFFAEE